MGTARRTGPHLEPWPRRCLITRHKSHVANRLRGVHLAYSQGCRQDSSSDEVTISRNKGGQPVAPSPELDPTTAADPTTAGSTAAGSTAAHDFSYGFDHLMTLFQEVLSARAAMTVARRAPLGRSRLVDAPRARLLLALEAYTAELNARNLPVPYGIRDDLRIQRRILGRVADAPS